MKLSRFIASALLSVMAMAIPMTAHAYYYPVDRQTYTCITPENCPGADHVQFNSFTNNPVVGDERPFVAGNINGQGSVQDRLQVKDGDTIVIRAYVHNNADATKMGGEQNTVAKNVKMYFLVPTAEQSDSTITGAIDASNATPAEVNDTMSVYASTPFTLQYVPGSAQFAHKPDGTHETTVKLSDSIVTSNGAALGDIPGCFAYSGYVTLSVKVHMKTTPVTPVYTCNLLTLTKDATNPRKVTASIAYTATPAATTKLTSVSYNFGKDGGNNDVTFTTSSTSQAYTYTTDGDHNVTAALTFDVNGKTVSGVTSTNCAASINTTPNTPPTTPPVLPNTGAGNVIGIFAGVVAASTIGYRLFLSRKLARR